MKPTIRQWLRFWAVPLLLILLGIIALGLPHLALIYTKGIQQSLPSIENEQPQAENNPQIATEQAPFGGVEIFCTEERATEFEPNHAVVCYSRPATAGVWFFYQFITGEWVPKSTSVYEKETITVWIPEDPGPTIKVRLVIGNEVIEEIFLIHAEYLGKKTISGPVV